MYEKASTAPSLAQPANIHALLASSRAYEFNHISDFTSPEKAVNLQHSRRLPNEFIRLIYGISNTADYLQQFPRQKWRQSVACSMLALGIFCGRRLSKDQVQSLSRVANFAWEVDQLDLICGQVDPSSGAPDLHDASRDYWHQVNSTYLRKDWLAQTDQLCSPSGGDFLTNWYDRQTVLDWWAKFFNHGLSPDAINQIAQSQTQASRWGLDDHRREILGEILQYQDQTESSASLPVGIDSQAYTYRSLTAKWFTQGWLEGADYHLPDWLHQRVTNLVFAQQAFDDLATVREDLKLGLSNLFLSPSSSTDAGQPTSTFEFQPQPTLSRLMHHVVDRLEVGRGVDSFSNQAKEWLLERGLRLGARWGAPRLARYAGCA